MDSAKIKDLANYKSLDEQLKMCLPLEEYLTQELDKQIPNSIVLTGLFSMKDVPENASIPRKAAHAMCFNLVDVDLGFERLHQLTRKAREIGPPNRLESVLRETFLEKISGFPSNEVDQVNFNTIKKITDILFHFQFSVIVFVMQIEKLKHYFTFKFHILIKEQKLLVI